MLPMQRFLFTSASLVLPSVPGIRNLGHFLLVEDRFVIAGPARGVGQVVVIDLNEFPARAQAGDAEVIEDGAVGALLRGEIDADTLVVKRRGDPAQVVVGFGIVLKLERMPLAGRTAGKSGTFDVC